MAYNFEVTYPRYKLLHTALQKFINEHVNYAGAVEEVLGMDHSVSPEHLFDINAEYFEEMETMLSELNELMDSDQI